ncbi:MAG: hypothetical protein WDM80_18580 [Limisphaerales bacterium]
MAANLVVLLAMPPTSPFDIFQASFLPVFTAALMVPKRQHRGPSGDAQNTAALPYMERALALEKFKSWMAWMDMK